MFYTWKKGTSEMTLNVFNSTVDFSLTSRDAAPQQIKDPTTLLSALLSELQLQSTLLIKL
jgi:hypothetical protein